MLEVKPEQKLTVALIERKPFITFDQNGSPKGLDVLIIENFAIRFNMRINNVLFNSPVNDVFNVNVYSHFPIHSTLR